MQAMHAPTLDALSCSFCGKAQETVGKLISSPSNHPRAYICDECVAACVSIIEDSRAATVEANPDAPGEPHPLLTHPLASEFMASVAKWVRQESLGQDGAEELGQMRNLASRMIAGARI